MHTEEKEILKRLVVAVDNLTTGLRVTTDGPIFPLATTKQVAAIFNVSVYSVRDWHKRGLLKGHHQVISGRVVRLVFTVRSLNEFFDENFPSDVDLGNPSDPRRRKGALVEKIRRMQALYARRRAPKM